jgi:hypothetical protein
MTLLHEVMGEKYHKMSGLVHVLHFCNDELQTIEEQIPESHHVYLKKLTQELSRLKSCLEAMKLFHKHHESYTRQSDLQSLLNLAQASLFTDKKALHFSMVPPLQPQQRVELGEETFRAVVLALKFFVLMNQETAQVQLSSTQSEFVFEMEINHHCTEVAEIFNFLETNQGQLGADYVEMIKPTVLLINSGYFNELNLSLVHKSSNPYIQLKVML